MKHKLFRNRVVKARDEVATLHTTLILAYPASSEGTLPDAARKAANNLRAAVAEIDRALVSLAKWTG